MNKKLLTKRLASFILISTLSMMKTEPFYYYKYNNPRVLRDFPVIFKKTEQKCLPFQPFSCPDSDVCLPLQYLCDDNQDCPDGYDEDSKLCTAAKRPPVDDIRNFLMNMVKENGKEFLVKLFGPRAMETLEPLGGVEPLAVALSESPTIANFAKALNLMSNDIVHLSDMLIKIEKGDPDTLRSLGIKQSSLTELKFFLNKLINTGFLE